jgi:hypothetical protein
MPLIGAKIGLCVLCVLFKGVLSCFTTPLEALRIASKCNTIPEKQHDLLNNKVENNTIMKLLTYKINPTT